MLRFQHVLIPSDFSDAARPAHELGAALAKQLDARATLLHVLPHTAATRLLGEPYAIWSEGEAGARSEKEVSESLTRLASELPLAVKTDLIWGHTVEGMRAYAIDHAVDLIVLGAFGRSALKSVMVGSVAERVARRSHCGVLIARTRGGLPKRIVIGTDLSGEARRGIDAGIEIAQACGAQVSLVHVHADAGDHPVLIGDVAADVLRRKLAQLAEPHAILPIETRLVTDDHPVRGLLSCVEEWDADLLVVTAQGLSAMERMLIGSVSEKLARHAPCSVLVVR